MELQDFLLECAKIERTIEISRQFLTKCPTFHPYQVFKEIDTHDQGFVTAQSFQLFLHRFGYLHTLKEFGILFYKPEFKYVDFLRFLLPQDQLLRDFIQNKEPTIKTSHECLEQVAKHISQEIILMNQLQPPNSFDQLQDGTREELDRLFKKERMFVYQDEIDAMIKRLDFYGDGQIDLLLFKNWVLILKKSIERDYNSAFQTPKKKVQFNNTSITTMKKSISNQRIVSPKKRIEQKLNQQQKQKLQLRGKIALKKQEQETEKKNMKEILTRKKSPNKQQKIKQKQPHEILEYLIDREIKIEKIKQQLALQSDFNTIDAFKILDIYNRGQIGQEEIDSIMNQKDGLSEQIIKRNNNQPLNYHNFLNLIQPQTNNYAEILNTRQSLNKKFKKITDIFNHETIKLFFGLLNILQQSTVKLNGNVQLFHKIDGITRDNYIGVSDLQQYLYECGLRYTHQEVILLINEYDKDKDGRLSLKEFLDI